MENVTVQEVADARSELERRLLEVINSFEFTYGVHVVGVAVKRVNWAALASDRESSAVEAVEVELRVPR